MKKRYADAGTALVFMMMLCVVTCAMAPAAGKAIPQTTSKVGVSAEFQPEVTRLNAQGLKLAEALEMSLEGTSRHLAAIFRRDKPKAPSETCEFRIIENEGATARTIFRRTDFFFTFDLGDASKLNGTDINKDGVKEVIVQSSSGGNCWACNPTEIYQLRNHKAELIAAGPILKIADLDADGIAELEIADTRWEVYDDFSHAASPGASMIYAWKNGHYVYASRDYAAFYKTALEEIRQDIEKEKPNITPQSDDFYVGRILSLAITYAHMGDAARGLAEMEQLLKQNSRNAEQTKHRREILEDFRNGDSAKKLKEMKYGDQIPLG
ncbi:MAG TPA: hypothetical protein VKM94_00520 [Blastocatellia bacterium]|nr:hypothetical protein [Blastocatellia bacterium]